MNVTFLYAGGEPWDSLDNFVLTLSRHCKRHAVRLVRFAGDCKGADVVLVTAEERTYPRPRVDQALQALKLMGVPFGMVHNNDNPGGATPWQYPSFCWTQRSFENLRRQGYEPLTLVRMPVFPALVSAEIPSQPVVVGTFGHIEPKKEIGSILTWAQRQNVDLNICGPNILEAQYADYILDLRRRGGHVYLYDWKERVESLIHVMPDATHFLFVLTTSKGKGGGCPVSPRYAGFMNRPVIVIDDEQTYRQDGYYVYPHLGAVESLEGMTPPDYSWSPDAYLDRLCGLTLAYWGK